MEVVEESGNQVDRREDSFMLINYHPSSFSLDYPKSAHDEIQAMSQWDRWTFTLSDFSKGTLRIHAKLMPALVAYVEE